MAQKKKIPLSSPFLSSWSWSSLLFVFFFFFLNTKGFYKKLSYAFSLSSHFWTFHFFFSFRHGIRFSFVHVFLSFLVFSFFFPSYTETAHSNRAGSKVLQSYGRCLFASSTANDCSKISIWNFVQHWRSHDGPPTPKKFGNCPTRLGIVKYVAPVKTSVIINDCKSVPTVSGLSRIRNPIPLGFSV